MPNEIRSHWPYFYSIPYTSAEYVDMLQAIEKRAQPLLDEILPHKILPSAQEFSTLTPDVTRFIIRQYEHNQQPNSGKIEKF